jgi:hypothetical protein
MTDLEELKHDLTVPKVLFNQRKSVHQALSKVLEIRNKWPKRMGFEEFKRLAEQINGEAFDGRISKNGIRILIELTCGRQLLPNPVVIAQVQPITRCV